MRCFYVLKNWSSAKVSLNRGLSLNKMSLNRGSTVLACASATDNKNFVRPCTVKSLTSEAMSSATQFFKGAYKISHFPGLQASWVDLPSFATLSKIWPNFKCKLILNSKLSKSHLNKKCTPNLIFFHEKKIRKIGMIFEIENSL